VLIERREKTNGGRPPRGARKVMFLLLYLKKIGLYRSNFAPPAFLIVRGKKLTRAARGLFFRGAAFGYAKMVSGGFFPIPTK